MTTETKRTLQDLIQERKCAASAGSCATCHWCTRDLDADPDSGFYAQCEIQGNVNPITFSKLELDSPDPKTPYPYGFCDEGVWGAFDACLAYDPIGQPTNECVRHHREYMVTLAQAAELTNAVTRILNGDLAKMLGDLGLKP